MPYTTRDILTSVFDATNNRLNTTATATISGDLNVATFDGAASFATNQVSITNAATAIVAARAGRRAVMIINHGATDVSIGGASVTTSNGLLLTGTAGAAVSIPTTAAVYGIVGTGTQTVSYIEVYD